jgi:membrane protease YdiL (CAAX protease family)
MSKLSTILRSYGGRFGLLLGSLAALDAACQVAGGLLVRHAPPSLQDIARLAAALFLAAAMIAAYRWLVRTLERRGADELGRVGAGPGLAFGVAAGVGLFGLIYLTLWSRGAASFQGYAGLSGVGHALSVAIYSGVGEEILFRGVVFRLLEERLGSSAALIISAAFFGCAHGANDGATWISALAIALEAGVLLGLAYMTTRSLWLPIGLHLGWNFTEGGIFGAAVSGGQYQGIFNAPLSGSPLITGGAFGPEASLAAVAISLIASALLAAWLVRTGAWRRGRRPGAAEGQAR